MPQELMEFCTQQQRRFDGATTADRRKEQGHFGTPGPIAEFMAGLFANFSKPLIRILDPGAGVGILSAAACHRALANPKVRHLFFELWENDPDLIPVLEQTMRQCQMTLRDSGRHMEFRIRCEDFIVENSSRTLFDFAERSEFDCVIMNPPYFKLRKDSRHAQVMKHVIHGQPNIYALFMAAAVELLAPHGEMVAITPRGYFSGPYFKRFRKWFFDRMTARRIHLFESRTDTFREDAVLQENVILHAERSGEKSHVALTSTMGRDLSDLKSSVLPYASIVDDSNGDHVIRVTTSGFEQAVVSVVDGLPNRFRDSGLDISTGPVVSFRATEFLRATRTEQTAPLLWLHNVRPFITRYPQHSSKPEHIQISDESKRLLVPAKTYVLLKRFSAKEEKRRLVAGILTPADTYAPWVGLENHLNYVYRKGGDLTRPEAFGLAAYFNSALVDVYFRTISGNTQVNATEIRGMPIPSGNTIANIGVEIQKIETHDRREVERVVCRALDIPPSLTEILLNLAP